MNRNLVSSRHRITETGETEQNTLLRILLIFSCPVLVEYVSCLFLSPLTKYSTQGFGILKQNVNESVSLLSWTVCHMQTSLFYFSTELLFTFSFLHSVGVLKSVVLIIFKIFISS